MSISENLIVSTVVPNGLTISWRADSLSMPCPEELERYHDRVLQPALVRLYPKSPTVKLQLLAVLLSPVAIVRVRYISPMLHQGGLEAKTIRTLPTAHRPRNRAHRQRRSDENA